MQFRDLYFEFDVEPISISTLSLKLNSNSVIPRNIRDYDEVNYLTSFEDVFSNKLTAVRCILAVHYRYNAYHRHLDIFDYIIDKCKKWICLDYDLKKREALHLTNQIFFKKLDIVEAMRDFFLMDELEVYGY